VGDLAERLFHDEAQSVRHKEVIVDYNADDLAMRLLIVSPVVPYPPSWGFATRVFQFVRLLSRRHEVTVVAYGNPAETDHVARLVELGATVHVVPRAVGIGAKRLTQIASVLSPRSYQWRGMYSAAMQKTLDDVMARGRFEIIQIESSQLAAFEYDPRASLVVDEHNVEYELLYRMYQTERTALRRAYNWLEYQKFKREEMGTWRRVAGCVTTSSREEAIVRQRAPGTPVVTVPNAVDVEYFQPPQAPAEGAAVALTGLMKYRPNVDAAQFFAGDILPRVHAVRPDVVFYVVGGDPAPEVRRLASDRVVVTDTVPDVRPYVHKSAVFVVPLRMGSGTRLKVLEGLAMAKAMVSTTIGCEGIEVVDCRHLLIRDDAEGFAAAVLELLQNRELGARLGAQGRELVFRKYRWETVVDDLERFHEEIRGGKHKSHSSG
jgi:glycosyltransferase involved in cell wall biosynthesis